jgi:hypothetical protein
MVCIEDDLLSMEIFIKNNHSHAAAAASRKNGFIVILELS